MVKTQLSGHGEKGFNIYDAIQHVSASYFEGVKVLGKIDIIPANSYVDLLQKELDGQMRKEEKLLRSLQKLNGDDYDYILIDTAPLPVTDIVITNVMVASDEILVPTKLEPFSSTGVELILPRIEQLIEEELNPELKINGILCTQVIGRRKNSNNEIEEALRDYAERKGIYVYESRIRSLEGVVSSQLSRKTLFAPKSYERTTLDKKGDKISKRFTSQTEIAKDYHMCLEEFIKRGDIN